jgi:hypothetical protein
MTSKVEANKALVYRYAQAVIDGDMETRRPRKPAADAVHRGTPAFA